MIDPAARSLNGSIPLGAVNPTSVIAAPDDRNGPRIYVSLSGIYPVTQAQQLNGGVVAVDPVSWVVDRMVLDDDVAGGNLGPLAVAGGGLAYSVVSDANLQNEVIAWDPRDGSVLRSVRASSYLIPSVTVGGGGLLAVPDRSPGSPGLCLYRTVSADPTIEETPLGCAPTALPPVSVIALDRGVSP